MLLVFIILRYRRKKQRGGDGEDYGAYGGGGAKERPGTSRSYNSMAEDAGGRDVKARPSDMMSPDSGTTKVGGLTRTNTLASTQPQGDAWELLSQPTPEDPLPKLGVVREPAGEALTTNYAVTKEVDRKPLKLAEPPLAKKKSFPSAGGAGGGDNNDNNADNYYNNNINNNNINNNNNKPGSSGAGTGGTTWSVFPKVDPDPKGLLAAAAQREVRPGSTQQAASLQKWLQSAVTVSPFGPLDSKTGPAGRSGPNANANANASVVAAESRTAKGAPPPSRMSEIRWPLPGGQGPRPQQQQQQQQLQTQEVGLAYAETPTVSTAAIARSVSMKGIGLPGKARKITR